MKYFLICVLVALVTVSSFVDSAPAAKKAAVKSCGNVCTANYSPVCAQDQSVKGSRPRTFGNKCVMEVHNCENKASMEVIYDGECKGSGGVRLS